MEATARTTIVASSSLEDTAVGTTVAITFTGTQ